jgi:hypothetical protein
MIRQVSIKEFGPEGIVYARLEAPGSICVMTVPGLTPIPPKTPVPEAPLVVVAGNHAEYLEFLEKRGIRDGRDANFFHPGMRLRGMLRPHVILTGRYFNRQDLRAIRSEILAAHDAIIETIDTI